MMKIINNKNKGENKMNSVNNKWMIWTIFGSSLFSIATQV